MDNQPLSSAPAWVRLAAPLLSRLPVGRYRAMNRICRKPPPAFLMRVPKALGGYSFRCDLRDVISREVCFTGHYEPAITAMVRATLKPGMSFVDVGANWGYFTLFAASLVGPGGYVLALEPDPRLVTTLRDNVTRDNLVQVTVLSVAAADQPGQLTLKGYDEQDENFGLSRIVANANGSAATFQVRADALDHIFLEQKSPTIDLLKMDIEGAEGLALVGLQASLAQRKIKRILLELHPAQLAELGSHPTTVTNLLAAAGYRAWTIDHSAAAIRRAAYRGVENVSDWLQPLQASAELDAWPHQLWLAPDIQ